MDILEQQQQPKKQRNHTSRREKKTRSYETDSVINPKSLRKWVLACKSLGVRSVFFLLLRFRR